MSLRKLDPTLSPEPLSARRCTIQFRYPELPEDRGSYWLVRLDDDPAIRQSMQTWLKPSVFAPVERRVA